MWVAYTVKICGIIECWQYYGVCEDYNGIILKILGDEGINLRIMSIQSLEAHQQYTHIVIVLIGYLDLSKSKGFYNKRSNRCHGS